MYTLLVSNLVEYVREGIVEVDRSRFLEYTSDAITTQLRSLSNEAVASLESWPCLVMQEGRSDERAFIAEIKSIRIAKGAVNFHVEALESKPPLLNADLWKLRTRLDLEQFEFSRHHCAVKDVDLLSVLESVGHSLVADGASRFQNRSLPAPERADLIVARKIIGDWGHTEIDDLVLEAGVEGLRAGRDVGSRRDRANAILQFLFDNPGAVTADHSLFSAYFVRAASSSDDVDGPEPEESEQHVGTGVSPPSLERREEITRSPNRVFIVHGHDEDVRDEVVEYLASIQLEPIVLHEQPNMGRHLLTKFIEEAELVTFAVVLMTGDDTGGSSPTDLRPRARQNVILELGYFLAHLGQPRVCALVAPGLETPSDFDGIVYIEIDDDGSRWRGELQRELLAAGMPVGET